jgi:hypothetical protein
MKYLVLMAAEEGGWDTATAEERQRVMDAHTAFHEAVAARAEMLAGEALAESARGRTLRWVDGAPVVTDGPYAKGVEQLGGFYLVAAGSQDEVLDLCRLLPSSYAVEVRPVIRIEGYEDTRDGG